VDPHGDGTDATHYRAAVDLVKLLPSIAELPRATDRRREQEAYDQRWLAQTLPIELGWMETDTEAGPFALDLGDRPDRPGSSFTVRDALGIARTSRPTCRRRAGGRSDRPAASAFSPTASLA
jgi:hypothetical protein